MASMKGVECGDFLLKLRMLLMIKLKDQEEVKSNI